MELYGQHFNSRAIGRIHAILDEEPTVSRRELSRRVCEELQWRSSNGKLKDADCRKALRELDRRGRIALPQCEVVYAFQEPGAYRQEDVPECEEIACRLKELGTIDVVPVSSRYCEAAKAWKALMSKHHYLGAPRLRGAQMRYQVRTEDGQWVGALSFDASTRRLRDRDEWIGWSEKARRAHLQLVVCNSRLLILPWVKVPHLASHVLGLVVGRLGDDWEERYGYRPALVETFVDPARFKGTCYRAANWTRIGKTSGRKYKGQERGTQKDIFVFPLRSNWKDVLCTEPHILPGSKKRPTCFDHWTEEEFGCVDLDDTRLKTRLYKIAEDFASNPGALVPQACEGSAARTKATYRFFENKQVSMDKLIDGHRESTIGRINSHGVVLAVQDTTTLNYTSHRSTRGLGPISTKKHKATGMFVHDTMAFTPKGTPLGLLDVQCWARDPKQAGKKYLRKKLPIEEKESMRWLTSYRRVAQAQKRCPTTRLVSVGDRESDIFELFNEARTTPDGPDLLIRAERSRNRKVENEYLWDRISREPVSGYRVVRVPPRSKTGPARDAKLAVRFAQVELTPPKDSKLAPVLLWAVHACEIEYGTEVNKPIDWMLLTTLEISTFEDAATCLAWYSQRWNIEIYHRTLKSGCRIEDRWLDSTDELKACLAVDMVVGWRVLWATKASRETPDVPCDVFFDRDEWHVLEAWSTNRVPDKPPSLRDAVRKVAQLGGFLGRKSDGEPGVTTIWRGLVKLEAMAIGWAMSEASHRTRDGP